MAGYLTRWPLLCAAAFAGWAVAGMPEPIADPTRPPAALAGEAGGVSEDGLRLSSVILPKQGRAAAVIGGQVVPLGGKVGDARLVKVAETGVVLEGPAGTERLYLTPDVEKTMHVTKSAVRRSKDKP